MYKQKIQPIKIIFTVWLTLQNFIVLLLDGNKHSFLKVSLKYETYNLRKEIRGVSIFNSLFTKCDYNPEICNIEYLPTKCLYHQKIIH